MRMGSELVFETNWTTGRELFVRINDKTYISMEYVLNVIDKEHDNFRDGSFRDKSLSYAQGWKQSNEAIRNAVKALADNSNTLNVLDALDTKEGKTK